MALHLIQVGHDRKRTNVGSGGAEKIGRMPEGAIVVKDGFVVTESGQLLTGPFYLMQKMYEGFNPSAGDWLLMMVRQNGTVAGVTGDKGAANVEYCGACHRKAPASQGGLWLLPKQVRAKR